ncbi:Fanconi anemia group J protein [Acrasis kona]|uniref:Fanconi anemia group J protein n=1 Tax=Acrasis kona TaxID=1008807 RepID=A0AAW2ZR15_9EUKA
MRSYQINGVDVEFPYKPYNAQIALMGKIIKTLSHQDAPANSDNGHHAILESPTGSGKSLSLLSASLAWQKKFKATKIMQWKENHEKVMSEIRQEPKETKTTLLRLGKRKREDEEEKEESDPKSESYDLPVAASGSSTASSSKEAPLSFKKRQEIKRIVDMLDKGYNDKASAAIMAQIGGVPKIFYGTRTHTQIKQVVRELKKTSYRPQICILGSRDQYCVNESVQNKKLNKKEECDRLKDHNKCVYHRNYNSLVDSPSIRPGGSHEVWDVEDLVDMGHEQNACPYFASREIYKKAELVLCPYNYLVDPMIRKAIPIDLKDQVVIIDEAHNIEDVCRSESSFTISLPEIVSAANELERMAKMNIRRDLHETMCEQLTLIGKWLTSNNEHLHSTSDFKLYSGRDQLLSMLQSFRLDPLKDDEKLKQLAVVEGAAGSNQKERQVYDNTLERVREIYNAILTYANNPKNKKRDPTVLSSKTCVTLEAIFTAVEHIVLNDMLFIEDFKVVVNKRVSMRAQMSRRGRGRGRGGISTYIQSPDEVVLNIWCMSPAVAFYYLQKKTRSVILTSGTLAPIEPLSTELGTLFNTTYEAPHVIDTKSQVWTGAISLGPNNTKLNASYTSASSTSFQDSLGQLILDHCELVRFGVLCFFPSYSMMDKMCERWSQTGLMDKLKSIKEVVQEPRQGKAAASVPEGLEDIEKDEDFKSLLDRFYNSIDEKNWKNNKNGGLFFS